MERKVKPGAPRTRRAAPSRRSPIRIPAEQADRFFDAINGIGKMRSRRVSARDIGKEYFDAELRLENLLVTMRRYEEILKQAKDVNEILRVETELGRLRADTEQTKRVPRSTSVLASMPPEPPD